MGNFLSIFRYSEFRSKKEGYDINRSHLLQLIFIPKPLVDKKIAICLLLMNNMLVWKAWLLRMPTPYLFSILAQGPKVINFIDLYGKEI